MLKICRANVRPDQENDRPAWRSIAPIWRTFAPRSFFVIFNPGDRSAGFWRTTGDRSAELQFLLFWAVDRPDLANDRRLFCCGVSPSFKKALFSCFFASISVLLSKSSIHSRNLLKHIKLEEITTIQYGKCDI